MLQIWEFDGSQGEMELRTLGPSDKRVEIVRRRGSSIGERAAGVDVHANDTRDRIRQRRMDRAESVLELEFVHSRGDGELTRVGTGCERERGRFGGEDYGPEIVVRLIGDVSQWRVDNVRDRYTPNQHSAVAEQDLETKHSSGEDATRYRRGPQ
jgi:hypothetical protein